MSKRCIGCEHFNGATPLYTIRAREPVIRGTCVVHPVWQSIGNGAEHFCGQWKEAAIKPPRIERS